MNVSDEGGKKSRSRPLHVAARDKPRTNVRKPICKFIQAYSYPRTQTASKEAADTQHVQLPAAYVSAAIMPRPCPHCPSSLSKEYVGTVGSLTTVQTHVCIPRYGLTEPEPAEQRAQSTAHAVVQVPYRRLTAHAVVTSAEQGYPPQQYQQGPPPGYQQGPQQFYQQVLYDRHSVACNSKFAMMLINTTV